MAYCLINTATTSFFFDNELIGSGKLNFQVTSFEIIQNKNVIIKLGQN
jgi:hypothetical protein